MITDYRARPEHFAYVLPVKPSKMQSILYGSSLEEHLRIDVIGSKLFHQIPKKPDIIFVQTPELQELRRIAGVPTACLTKADEAASHSLSNLAYDSDPGDRDFVGNILAALESTVNLIEPFTRIRDALLEARKSTERS
jgi:hypothetical protein